MRALAATASSLDAGMEDHCELTSPHTLSVGGSSHVSVIEEISAELQRTFP